MENTSKDNTVTPTYWRARMSDLILKAKLFIYTFGEAWVSWRDACRYLDGYMCCNGQECCCGGYTQREFWERKFENITKRRNSQ